jgi:hypothetical protein
MKDPLVIALTVILIAFIVSGTAATVYNVATFKKRSDEEAERRGLSRYI